METVKSKDSKYVLKLPRGNKKNNPSNNQSGKPRGFTAFVRRVRIWTARPLAFDPHF